MSTQSGTWVDLDDVRRMAVGDENFRKYADCGLRVVDLEDGIEVPMCVEVDCDNGVARCYVDNPDGSPKVVDGEAATEERRGRFVVQAWMPGRRDAAE